MKNVVRSVVGRALAGAALCSWLALAGPAAAQQVVREAGRSCAQGNITDTPDLQAFSLAVGYAHDIAKAPETRAFKVGLFVGADWVGSSDVVKYKHNRKPWVAFQVGFDFFDQGPRPADAATAGFCAVRSSAGSSGGGAGR